MHEYPPEFDQENLDNKYLSEAFPEANSPYELDRHVYKYTSCGAHLSVLIEYYKTIEPDGFEEYPADKHVSEWVHSGNLKSLGTWSDMDQMGVLITGFMLGSIVEGVDETTNSIELVIKQLDEEPQEFANRFELALRDIERQAEEIWNNTHGCETCANHFGIDLNVKLSPIWSECPDCDGNGDVI